MSRTKEVKPFDVGDHVWVVGSNGDKKEYYTRKILQIDWSDIENDWLVRVDGGLSLKEQDEMLCGGRWFVKAKKETESRPPETLEVLQKIEKHLSQLCLCVRKEVNGYYPSYHIATHEREVNHE